MSNDDVSEADTAIVFILSWLAVKSDDMAAVARAVGLVDARVCAVEQGLHESGPTIVALPPPRTLWSRLFGSRSSVKPLDAGKKCFIAPPIEGWTLVFGAEIAFEDELRAELSRVFGEAQAFYSDAKYCGYLWARSCAGKTVRAVSVADADITSEGESSPPEPSDLSRANEYDVLRIARAWSVDPNALLRDGAPGELGTRRER